MTIFRLILVFLLTLTLQAQQGGMWIPSLLDGMNEAEMQHLGMKLSAKDIYDINNSSLKDAIVHFNGGCSSEIISPKGLLLTNHHCGYSQIQSHSTMEDNYIEDGFWAKTLAEELPNKGVVATFIIRIEDVTAQVLEGVDALTTEIEKQAKIQQNIAQTTASFPKETWQDNRISAFYEGNQYMLFVTETYKDVRLVGTPPNSIGKFGSDTDNWVWPRHTGDFALFRIYADKNNRPAEYSTDNIPYTPKHFLPISLSGVEEDDFTMVFGFPGVTNEYLPAVAVEQVINDLNPARIELRDNALKVMDKYMRNDASVKLQYTSKFARIANYWKKWIGESQGLKKAQAVQAKRDFETEFINRARTKGLQMQSGKLFSDFDTYYNLITPYSVSREYFMEVVLRNTELLTMGYRLYQLEKVFYERGEQSFTDRKNNAIASMENFYKNYHAPLDKEVFEAMITMYANKSPKSFLPQELTDTNPSVLTNNIYTNSKLTSYQGFKELLNGSTQEVLEKLNQDPGVAFAKQLAIAYETNVQPQYSAYDMEIQALQRTYMSMILELFPDDRIFPDANRTMRITYGKVKGYSPNDAVYYSPVTYLDGVIEKYIPGDYEFDVPQKLIDLYHAKDYGQYGKDGKLAVNFIATNHTTGGNSGSPALDAHGNLIGLNFDRVWEGTMSDIYYDPEICRNIMVDMRYVLFIIDKYAGAKHLVDEMKIVFPKGK